jgi:hypothetical protein
LRKIVSEAIESIPLITKDHILLVQTLLDIRWISRCEEIVELFHKFILNLLTSKSDFLMLCLSKIISCFIPHGELLMSLVSGAHFTHFPSLDDDSEHWKSGNPTAELDGKLQLVHNLIQKILDVMPMLPVQMRKQIRIEFPYYKQASFKIVAYIHNLLLLLDTRRAGTDLRESGDYRRERDSRADRRVGRRL